MSNKSENLRKITNKSPIPINLVKNMNLYLIENEEVTFEFNIKNYTDGNSTEYHLRFLFDKPGVNVYLSENFPFPNKYAYTKKYPENNNNQDIPIEIIYNLKPEENKFYMTVEALTKIGDLEIDVQTCDNEKRCSRDWVQYYFFIGLSGFGVFILIYGIYICFFETTFKKESNIFDIK